MLPVGTVLEAVGGTYRIRPEGTRFELEAVLRGRLKQEARTGDRVVAGDRVRFRQEDGDSATIEEVLPRVSEFVRAAPSGHRAKIVAANVDHVLVVLAASDPPFRNDVADRFLVLAETSGGSPRLVINKTDLVPPGPAGRAALEGGLDAYRRIGYPVLATSAVSGEGMGDFAELLSGGTSVLVGPSGVGKSSLLNAVDPSLGLRTGLVGAKGRGRHTTVSARLLPLEGGGAVVDTPGFSDVALWRTDPALLAAAFPEVRERAGSCRFRDCRHLEEPGCAVRDALARGEMDEDRYASYRALRAEAESSSSR